MDRRHIFHRLACLFFPDVRRNLANQASKDFVLQFDNGYFDNDTKQKVEKLNKVLTKHNGDVPYLVKYIIEDLKKAHPTVDKTTPFVLEK